MMVALSRAQDATTAGAGTGTATAYNYDDSYDYDSYGIDQRKKTQAEKDAAKGTNLLHFSEILINFF